MRGPRLEAERPQPPPGSPRPAGAMPTGPQAPREPTWEMEITQEVTLQCEGSLWVKLVYSGSCFITVNDTYHPLAIAGLGLLLLALNKFMLHRPTGL